MYNLAFLATLFKSLVSVSEKHVLKNENSSIYASELSLVLAIVSIPLFFFVSNFSIDGKTLTFIYLVSILSFVTSITSAYVMKKLDISESSALFALSPILVATLASIFLKELFSLVQILGIIISCIGVYILERHNFNKDTLNVQPAHAIPHSYIHPETVSAIHTFGTYKVLVISLIFFSFAVIGDKYIIFHMGTDPLLYLLIIQFFVLLNFAVFDLFSYRTTRRPFFSPQLLLKKSFWANIIFIIGHRVTHVFALQVVPIGILNTIKQLASVITTIVGGTFFSEKHLWRRTIACFFIVVGIVLVIL